MKNLLTLVCCLVLSTLVYAEDKLPKATLKGDTLFIENTHAIHTYLWDGQLRLLSIVNLTDGVNYFSTDPKPDIFLAKESQDFQKVDFSTEIVQNYPIENPYLKVSLVSSSESLQLNHDLIMYEHSGAIRHQYAIKGEASEKIWEIAGNEGNPMIENIRVGIAENTRIGVLSGLSPHTRYELVSFKEATDYHDNMVTKQTLFPFRQAQQVQGNLIVARLPHANTSLWMLKESPIAWSQSSYPGFDFTIYNWGVAMNGLGIEPRILSSDQWIAVYSFARGLSKQEDLAERKDWLTYQMMLRKYDTNRDAMILANTWGDRSQDSRMNEEFILKEIEAAAQLGITHLQLDDGWQQGLSKNSASKAGMKWDDWTLEDWQPHAERFPNGLKSIVEKANQSGVEICLWFNPSKSDYYKNWERDASILISYFRELGIKVFKIDGLELGNLEAETNVRKFFTAVMDATEGTATFNLDVTAGKRVGYHYMQEFGNVFLENRYTDWGNYYPYRSLRNLWMLASYVPSSRLQIEWLNVFRNAGKYAANDIHAPSNVGLPYAFSATLAAQPLAWMEVSGLPTGQEDLRNLLKVYSNHSSNWHASVVLPLGEEPSGVSWLGFWIHTPLEPHDYLLVYKEASEADSFSFHLPDNYTDFDIIYGESIASDLQTNQLMLTIEGTYQFLIIKLKH
ncbi:MAG: alpha-galactosidase [Mongoliitalea sp.]